MHENNAFVNPIYKERIKNMERLIPAGKLPQKTSLDIPFSKIGIGFEKLDRAVFDPEKAYDKVARIGIKKIRLQSGWQRTEKEKGVYDFTWLDDIVDNLIRRGMEPWLCLCYGNKLYTPLAEVVFGAVGCPPINTQEAMDAWLRYVKATAEHYKGKISFYEIWNEPDCKYSWKHTLGEEPDQARNAREYGEFSEATTVAIKEADPDARVGINIAHVVDLPFTHNVLSVGKLSQVLDTVTYHCYSSNDQRRCDQVTALRELVHMHNPKLTLVQGESGAQSRSDGHGAMHHFAWSPERQTKLLLRTLIQDLYTDVEFTSYFSTMDMVEALNGLVDNKASYLDYGYFGVISATFDEDGRATGDYTEKPSYYALSALCSLMEGDVRPTAVPYSREVLSSRRVNGHDCNDETIRIYPFTLADGRTALTYWNATPILTTTYEGTITLCIRPTDRDSVTLIDLRDGTVYKLPENMTEETGNGMLRLRNMPITDAPLALVYR